MVGGEEGESAEKRNFDGIYVVGGEEGESAEKRNFDGSKIAFPFHNCKDTEANAR